MGFDLQPSLGKGQVSLSTQWGDPSLGLSGFQTICLPFQTEVQVLGNEDDDGLGKESWEFVVCSVPGLPHATSPAGDAGTIVPLRWLMGASGAASSADSPCPQQRSPCRDNSLRCGGGCLRGRAGDRPGGVVGAQRGLGGYGRAGGRRMSSRARRCPRRAGTRVLSWLSQGFERILPQPEGMKKPEVSAAQLGKSGGYRAEMRVGRAPCLHPPAHPSWDLGEEKPRTSSRAKRDLWALSRCSLTLMQGGRFIWD